MPRVEKKEESWWWDEFKSWFTKKNDYLKGSLVIHHGFHEIKVPVDHCMKPKKVYLSCEEQCVPVCHGSINWVGGRVVEDGFILYADIKTNTAEVDWLLEFRPRH